MLLSYSIVSCIILCFGYAGYRLVMSGERQHSFNRCIILCLYFISLILPLFLNSIIDICHFSRFSSTQSVEIGELSGGIIEQSEISLFSSSLTGHQIAILLYMYYSGIIMVTLFFIWSIITIINTIRKGEKIDYEDFTLVLVDDSDIVPFSWRHYIVMSCTDYNNEAEMIILHECGHLRHVHWIDILISWLVLALQWYNPVSWYMRKELKAVHEYQADENVVMSGANIRLYQMLLLKKAVGPRFHPLANSLNHSKLKKRVTMMYKKKSSLKRRLCALILVPAIAAGCALISIPSVAGILESFSSSGSGTNSSDTPQQLVSTAPASLQSQSPSQNPGVYTGQMTISSNDGESATFPVKIEIPGASDDNSEICSAPEVLPEAPGGIEGLMQYLMKSLIYPKEAWEANLQGRVVVKFVVEKDGSIGTTEIVRSVAPSLDQEAIRVIKDMPKWTPGKVNGEPVACWFILPVIFKLPSDTSKEKK